MSGDDQVRVTCASVGCGRAYAAAEKRADPAAAVAAARAHALAMAEVRARVIVELARSPLPGALLVLAGALAFQSVVWAVVR